MSSTNKKAKQSAGILSKIVSLCKRRGFVYPGSEIYGGLANTFDYGPLGTAILRNIKTDWWNTFVDQREDIYGIDGGIILNRKVWQASGHTKGFIDVLAECKKCHLRHQVDKLAKGEKNCPDCGGELTKARKFNPMFKTYIGPLQDKDAIAYLRPETAQAIFINFHNVVNSFSPKLPFGIAQIGKAFRNEITLGKFIFRTLEFEQMEIEYFIREKDWQKYFEQWKKAIEAWAISLGIKKKSLRWRNHDQEELAHYSKKTEDLEFSFDGEYRELYGFAYRTDFDLKNHAKISKKNLVYRDPNTGEKFFPHVVEPSFGVNRTFLAVLYDAYTEEKDRIVLKLSPKIAPFQVAVFPLLANKEGLVERASKIYQQLKNSFTVTLDKSGNIGKRYRRQDEIGTPWCVTVDFKSLDNNTVTVRDRDSMEQERVPVKKLISYFAKKIGQAVDKCC